MTRLIKALLFTGLLFGLQAAAPASAADAGVNLTKYAASPIASDDLVRPGQAIKVAGKRGRRIRNGVAAGVAIGVAGLILSEAIRDARRNDRVYYYSERPRPRRRYYDNYPGRRACRRIARRCDNGNRRACRRWYRQCD